MYVLRWRRGKHNLSTQAGASVLAALVLVAILGAVLLIFQYIRTSGDFAYQPASLLADVDQSGNGGTQALTDACANGTVHTIDESSGATANPQETPTGGLKCWVKDPNAGTSNANPKDQNGMMPGPDAGSTVCNLSKPDKCVVQYCLPASMLNSTGDPALGSSAGYKGCIVVNCGSSAGADCLKNTMSTLAASPATAPSALVASTLINDDKTPIITGNASNESQFLTQALSPEGEQGVESQISSAQSSPDATDAQVESLGNLAETVQSGTPPCTAGSAGCAPTTVLNSDLSSNGQTNLLGEYNETSTNDPAVAQANADTPPCTPSNTGSNCSGGSGAASTFGQPCPAPQTGTQPNCVTPPPAPATPITTSAPKTTTTTGGNSNLISGATAFLTGLVQGVTRGLQNQQLAQAIQSSQAAAAPYGVGTDGTACPAPQAQPPASQCTVGFWQQQYQTNQCPTTWTCVPNTSAAPAPAASSAAASPSTTPSAPVASQPSASISCQPQTADVGMSVSISYACTNATGSAGGGFITNNQLSGSTTTVIAVPPSGTNTASYSLTCINQSLTAGAQCSVQINQPSIVLIANPSAVAVGSSTAIGWVTSGMSACTISSPDSAAFTAANAGNTSVNGVATTPPLTAAMQAVLNCQTIAGGTDSAMTNVSVGGAGTAGSTSGTGANAAPPVSVSSTADGGSIAHGGSVTITWNSVNPPAGSAMSLWLVDEQTKKADTVIAGGLSPNGVYTWNVPAVGAACNPNASNVCDTDLVQGDSYAIEAVLYTPSDAYVGDGTAPSNPIAPTYGASAVGGAFTLDDGSGSSEGGE